MNLAVGKQHARNQAGGDTSQRLALLRQSRASSARGEAVARQVNELYTLVDANKEIWDYGVANLAKAEAALGSTARH